MSLNQSLDKILIIDFGSQFTQLIARRIRELGVFSEIISHKKINQAYLKSLKSNPNLNTVFIDVSDINFVENKLDYMELLFRIKKSLV